MKKKKKINDVGSAIVTVLIVALVISILATTILYLAATNFKMKKTEQHTKEQFYSTELPLEEIRAQFLVWASESASEAYVDTLSKYATMTADVREAYYISKFCEIYKKKWNDEFAAVGGSDDKECLIKTLKLHVSAPFDDPTNPDTAKFDIVGPVPTGGISVNSSNGTITISNLKVIYTNSSDYTSVITTDFKVTAPKINFDIETNTSVASETERTQFDMSNCVQYINWEKK